MDPNCYSPLKVFHHQDRIEALRRGDHPPPVHLHLVPTNRCNQNCSFCAYRSEGYTSSETFNLHDEIPRDRLLSLASEAKALGVKAVELTGGGEPTIHPQFIEFCGRLEARELNYAVVTNGVALGRYHIVALSRSTWTRFSIDAATPETYAQLRRAKLSTINTVRANLRELICARGNGTVVGVGFVVTKDNWREILQATRSAKEDGADNIRISAVFQNDGADYFRIFHSGARNLCRQAKAQENGKFAVFDLFGQRLDDLTQRSPSYERCHVQRLVNYIGADQNVYRCCVLAYNKRGLLGSIRDRTLKEFWYDPETRQRLDEFDARECPRCMFNAKNQTIDYALNHKPPHVNFL